MKVKYYKIKINWRFDRSCRIFIEISANIIVSILIKLSIYTQHYCPSMGKGMYGMNVHKAVANKEKKQA
jgi:hypothetical protein